MKNRIRLVDTWTLKNAKDEDIPMWMRPTRLPRNAALERRHARGGHLSKTLRERRKIKWTLVSSTYTWYGDGHARNENAAASTTVILKPNR